MGIPSLYFNNALGYVYQHADEFVRIEWRDAPMTRVDLRAVYEHTLNLLRRSGLRKVLSDHRYMPPYRLEDRDWIMADWIPRAVRDANYEYCAVVQAHNVFNRLTTHQMIVEAEKSTLTVKYFDEPEPAEQWLRKVK